MMNEQAHAPALWRAAVLVSLAGIFLGIGYAILSLPTHATGLAAPVEAALDRSGVSHPVTAVLLNFRGYDTLLETAVLLIALLGAWSLGASPSAATDATGGPALAYLVRVLTPLIVLVAGYLLWKGAHSPGGAFQAGAALGAAGVLLSVAGRPAPAWWRGWRARAAAALGVTVFAGIGAACVTAGGALLQYPPARAGGLILIIETAAALSIAVTLAALFTGEPPREDA